MCVLRIVNSQKILKCMFLVFPENNKEHLRKNSLVCQVYLFIYFYCHLID